MSGMGEAYIKALNDEEDKRLSKQVRMIDKARLAELKEKFRYQQSIADTVKGNPSLGRVMLCDLRDYADLLSILSDYEAAMPLIEAVMKAELFSIEGYIGEDRLYRDDVDRILRAVIDLKKKLKERGGK